jgi:mRNA interferase YafQ
MAEEPSAPEPEQEPAPPAPAEEAPQGEEGSPFPLRSTTTKQFDRDWKRCKKRSKDMEKLASVMRSLINGHELETRLRDHLLSDQWKGARECHIEPDWLLIYMPGETEIVFMRTGSHSDVFR